MDRLRGDGHMDRPARFRSHLWLQADRHGCAGRASLREERGFRIDTTPGVACFHASMYQHLVAERFYHLYSDGEAP